MKLRSGKTYKYKNYAKKKSLVKKVAKLAKKVNSNTSNLLRQYNALSTGTFTLIIQNPGTVYPMNLLAVGAGDNARAGNSFEIKRFRLALQIELRLRNVATTPFMPVIRLMVLWDKSPNGVLPIPSDFLNYGASATSIPLASVDFNSRKRFKVLYDTRFTMNATAQTGVAPNLLEYGNVTKNITIKKKLNKITLGNNLGTAAIADVRSGLLFYYIQADSTVEWNTYFSVGYQLIYTE